MHRDFDAEVAERAREADPIEFTLGGVRFVCLPVCPFGAVLDLSAAPEITVDLAGAVAGIVAFLEQVVVDEHRSAVEAAVPLPEATVPVANIASTDREDLAPEAGPELSAPLERRSEPEAGHLRAPSGGLADPIREPTTRSRPTRSTPVSRRPPKAAS